MNSSKFVFVVLSILLSTLTFWIGMTEGRTLRVYTVNVTTDPADLHVTYNLNNDKINMNLTFLRDIGENIKFNVEVQLNVKGKYKSLGKVMNLNFCNALKHSSKDSFVKFLFEDIRRLNMTCPIKKKTYYMKDYTFRGESLPPLTPIGEYRFIATFMKVAQKKRNVLIHFSVDAAAHA